MKRVLLLVMIAETGMYASNDGKCHKRSMSLPGGSFNYDSRFATSASSSSVSSFDEDVVCTQPRIADKDIETKGDGFSLNIEKCEKDCKRLCFITCLLCTAVDCPCPVSCAVAGVFSLLSSYMNLKEDRQAHS